MRHFAHLSCVGLAATWMLLNSAPAGAVAPADDVSGLEMVASPPSLSAPAAHAASAPDAASHAFGTALESVTSQGWLTSWNLATGLPHRATPASYDAALSARVVPAGSTSPSREAMLDARAVEAMAREFYDTLQLLDGRLPLGDQLRPFVIEKQGGVWWTIFEQTLDGLPVEGARADFRFSADGHLLFYGLSLIPDAEPVGAALLDVAAAHDVAIASLVREGLRFDVLQPSAVNGVVASAVLERDRVLAAGPVLSPYLTYLPVYSNDGLLVELHLVQVVRTDVSNPPARFRTYVDAVTGDVLRRENEFHYLDISGHASSSVRPTNPFDAPVDLDQRDLRVTALGVGDVITNEDGTFSLTTPDALPRTVQSTLSGSFAHIDDAGGTQPLYQAVQTPGTPFELHFDDSNSHAAERDGFHHTNVVHAWQKSIDPSFTGTDYEMNVRVNISQTCNAFWDGSGINFYSAGGGCQNTAEIADVVYHEYGHGTNQFAYAPGSPSGAEHEGMADYQAASITNQPNIGLGFYGNGTILRTCDNNRQWPAPECGGEVHCVGEVIAGALWHMRENLVDRLGQTAGVELSDDLFHYARFGRDNTFEGYYFDLLAVDDDNGTLADGTPHDTQIVSAFDRHNIGPGWTLEILHAQLSDTDDEVTPRSVRAVFSSPAEISPGSPTLYYATGPIGGSHGAFTSVAMTATAEIREFEGFIPAQSWGIEVSYYLAGAADTLGITATLPAGAPGTVFTYKVEEDTQVPQVMHESLADKSAAIWPVLARAEVTDNQSIGSVEVEWLVNGSARPTFELAPDEGDLFDGAFSAGVSEGDQVDYRVKASDGATPPNVTYVPSSGYLQFDIVHDYADEMEDGIQDWTHAVGTDGFVDSWHLSTERNVTPGGSHSWKFGQVGGGYLDGSDGVLLTAPVALGDGATLTFQHWLDAEDDANNTAWDGALLEISTDGGSSWAVLPPVGGYTHTIIENPASPFPAGYPCWSGSFNWRSEQFDLAAYSGNVVQIRFRFGSDGFVTGQGWFVDSMLLDPGEGGVSSTPGALLPTRTELLGALPNPYRGTGIGTEVRFRLAESADVTLEVLDVAGRRVRSLVHDSMDAGSHSVVWDARNDHGSRLGSGVYFLRLSHGTTELSRKVLIAR
ncbi:MAG: FlgD immunoglobulin-like domain containing protein [Candidatus Eisenbacteria bacterium]